MIPKIIGGPISTKERWPNRIHNRRYLYTIQCVLKSVTYSIDVVLIFDAYTRGAWVPWIVGYSACGKTTFIDALNACGLGTEYVPIFEQAREYIDEHWWRLVTEPRGI